MKKLIVLLIVTLLAGCASFGQPDYVQTRPPATAWQWEHVSDQVMRDMCPEWRHLPGLQGCSFVIIKTNKCWTYSKLSEEEAKHSFMRFQGQNMWEDEKKHCDGYEHWEHVKR